MIGFGRSQPGIGVRVSCSILALAIGSMSVAHAQTATPAASADEIVVTGIRASLEDAVNQKRNADVILDGISADDIGNIPDLNLGEALQRIPGIQLDRDEDRRRSGISVRGLPATFTKITLMGQDVASASAQVGRSNPFGAFDSSIFNGVNVIKSFTPDIVAGGLGANVDLRLTPALSRKDGQFAIRAELGYEETPEAITPGYFASFSKHLFDHTVGVYATAVYTKQRFRRDSVQFNSYLNYIPNAVRPATPTAACPLVIPTVFTPTATCNPFGQYINTADPAAEATIRALDPNPRVANDYTVFAPGTVRQFTEQSGGNRISAAAGIEWKAGDNLSFRVDGLFTQRKLDDNLLDGSDLNFNATTITPIGDPQSIGVQNGVPAYYSPHISFVNPVYNIENRTFNSKEQVWGLFPQLEFKNDDWTINLIGSYSKAQNNFIQEQFRLAITRAAGTATNGLTGELNTGNGNFSDYLLSLNMPSNAIVFTGFPIPSPSTAPNVAGQPARFPANGNGVTVVFNGGRNQFLLAANTQATNRSLKSAELGIERRLNFGPLTAVKVGARWQEDDGLVRRENNSLLGTRYERIDNSILILNSASTSGGTFFGGVAPGYLAGLLSLDIQRIRDLILPIDPTRLPPGATQNFQNDYYRSLPITNTAAQNWGSDRQNIEGYAMAKYSLADITPLNIRGNFGVRYTRTKLGGNLLPVIDGTGTVVRPADPRVEIEYESYLPSANLIWNITNDLVLNAAYYHTFEALNLTEFSPAPNAYSLQNTDGDADFDRLSVNASALEREPRASKAIDLGLTWYNRRGSLIGVNLFRKAIQADYTPSQVCPGSFSVVLPTAITFNGLTFNSSNQCVTSSDVQVRSGTTTETLPAGSEIVINQFVRSPGKLIIKGVEAQAQQNLSFLSSPVLKNFGFQANVSYVTANQQLFGVSKWTYNLIGYWENEHFAFRLARNTRSNNDIAAGGSFQGNGRTVRGRSQLDASMRVSPVKNLDLRLEAFNITNVQRLDYEFVEGFSRRNDYDGRTYSLSLQYKF